MTPNESITPKGDPYAPREDSELLRQAILFQDSRGLFLEIGVGMGSNLKGLENRFSLVVGTDIQSRGAMIDAKDKGVELVIADRASCFRDHVFDLVACNPPYLPSSEIEDKAVDGGLLGLEVPLKFLSEALRVSRHDAKIIVILSSLGDLSEFRSFCDKIEISCEVIMEKRLFFEILYAYLIRRKFGD